MTQSTLSRSVRAQMGDAGVLPAINLIPGEYAAVRTLRRLQLGLGVAVLAAVAAVAGLAHLAAGVEAQHRDRLATQQDQVTGLRREAARYVPVTKTAQDVDAARATLRAALGHEVRWSRFLAALSQTAPKTIQIKTLTVTQQEATGTTAPPTASTTGGSAPTELGKTPGLEQVADPVGLLTVSGLTGKQTDVARWLDSIGGQLGIAAPYISTATREGDTTVVNFQSTAVLTSELLSQRYTNDEAGLR